MRPILLPFAAILVSAAPPADDGSMMPGYGEPARKWHSIEDAKAALNCRDTIERIRDEGGQPKLDREPASPEKPLMIAAVDKGIDGCAVMQMKGDVNDLRPIPAPPEGPTQVQPAS